MSEQIGRLFLMLVRGFERDPQAAMAAALLLMYGVTVRQVTRLRWGDLCAAVGSWRLGDDDLPLSAQVLAMQAEYRERVGGMSGGLMFAGRNGKALRVADLSARIDDLSGDVYPVATLRGFARCACGVLLDKCALRHVLDEYDRMGATSGQVERLAVDLQARRKAAIGTYHSWLALTAERVEKATSGAGCGVIR